MNKNSVIRETNIPFTYELEDFSTTDFISYYKANESSFEKALYVYGALKFKGISINQLSDFQVIVDSISDRFLAYIDGNSPRTKLSGNVYTSTEYDKSLKITMHNELSYSARWPRKLFFSCLQPAESGGETLIADSRRIIGNLNKDIVSEIEKKGIFYIRNLHGGMGFGPSWQDTFETDDKTLVENYCRNYGIIYDWHEDDSLRLKQYSRGIIEHTVTKEKVWFNQIDQFHPCHLGQELFETLQIMYESAENFPTYVTFGDQTTIDEKMVLEILEAIEKVTIAPLWNKNELMIVDNELVAHGRSSYTGDRNVLVAMSE